MRIIRRWKRQIRDDLPSRWSVEVNDRWKTVSQWRRSETSCTLGGRRSSSLDDLPASASRPASNRNRKQIQRCRWSPPTCFLSKLKRKPAVRSIVSSKLRRKLAVRSLISSKVLSTARISFVYARSTSIGLTRRAFVGGTQSRCHRREIVWTWYHVVRHIV